MDYSEMGRRSWSEFENQHGKRKARKLMAEKGRKGWLALVANFESEAEAKQYTANLAKATFFKHTRPGFARELMQQYFDKFPQLERKYPGVKT